MVLREQELIPLGMPPPGASWCRLGSGDEARGGSPRVMHGQGINRDHLIIIRSQGNSSLTRAKAATREREEAQQDMLTGKVLSRSGITHRASLDIWSHVHQEPVRERQGPDELAKGSNSGDMKHMPLRMGS